MKSILIICSYHHKNTEKIAKAIAEVLEAPMMPPQQADPEELRACDLVGFGSGIYSSSCHGDLLALAEVLPNAPGKRAFIFSTSGGPAFFDRYDGSYREKYARECHEPLRDRLLSKGYSVVGEFSCAGHNSNGFLRLFGGINKGRPDAEDLSRAREFARRLKDG